MKALQSFSRSLRNEVDIGTSRQEPDPEASEREDAAKAPFACLHPNQNPAAIA